MSGGQYALCLFHQQAVVARGDVLCVGFGVEPLGFLSAEESFPLQIAPEVNGAGTWPYARCQRSSQCRIASPRQSSDSNQRRLRRSERGERGSKVSPRPLRLLMGCLPVLACLLLLRPLGCDQGSDASS